jgi:hypothetical protein
MGVCETYWAISQIQFDADIVDNSLETVDNSI